MAYQFGGQLIVDIVKDEHLLKGLIIPGYIKTMLKKNSTKVKVINSRSREFDVSIEASGYNVVKITGSDDWENFVTSSVTDSTTKLCFKCLRLNTFEVICFDENGLEMHVAPRLCNLVKRCVVVADGQTEVQEYLPKKFLDPLRVEKKLKPVNTASVFGPRQHEDVQLIWVYDPNMDRWEEKAKGGWYATGCHGSKWTNLCFENNVQEGYTMMFHYIIEDQCFTFDVFNQEGVGLGVTTLGHYIDGNKFKKVTYAKLEDDADGVNLAYHFCRIKDHKCKHNGPDVLIMPFEYHALSTHHLTFPADFVRYHHLNNFHMAVINYGTLKFDVRLAILEDPRREGDESHVVLVYDWMKFSASTGILSQEPIKFQLIWNKCIPGEVVYFDIC